MASGNTLLDLHPLQGEAPSSAYATLDRRNGHWVLDFDPDTDESIIFSRVLPRTYAGGGITVYLHVSFTSAVANAARFAVAFERVGDGSQDVDSDGFATAQEVSITAPGTSGHVEIANVAFTNGAQMDSIAVGEKFRIKVTRKGTDATNDTATGDAELHAIELKET